MQDHPLLLTNVLDYAAKWHNEQVSEYSVLSRLAHVHGSVRYSALNACCNSNAEMSEQTK